MSGRQVTDRSAADLTEQAMHDYGTYVIGGRAVGDRRDGLKPVQRRILLAMYSMGRGKDFVKCAGIVGETLKRYHPHGDSAVYGALVGMVHDRYPLVEGRGNFGGPDGSPPAAYRYTEARLTPLARRLFDDVAVAPQTDSYAGNQQEPLYLTAPLPLLLLNGSEGIAVGLNSNVPPHHVGEVVAALKVLIEKPGDVEAVLKKVLGPDYGTGVRLAQSEQVAKVYHGRRGALRFGSSYFFEEDDDHHRLVVTSVAPRFNLQQFVQRVGRWTDGGQIVYVNDESSAEGTRIVVGFTDRQALETYVLPEIETNVTFQWYSVARDIEGHDNLLYAGFFDVLQAWLDNRRSDVLASLKHEEGLLKQDLFRLEAKSWAAAHPDEIAKAWQRPSAPGAQKVLVDALVVNDHLNPAFFKTWPNTPTSRATMAVVEILLDLKLGSVMGYNREHLDDVIAKKQAALESCWAAQTEKGVDRTIVGQVTELAKVLKGPRGTVIPPKGKGVAVVSDVPDVRGETWLAVSAEGKCQRWSKAPVLVKEWDWDHLVCAGSAAYWVLENNKVWRMDLLRATKDGQQAHGDVVALVSDRDSRIVLVSDDDKVVVNDLTQKSLSRKEFEVWPTAIRDAKEIKIAVGLRSGDKLLLVSQGIGDPVTYKMVMLDGDKLQTSWRGKSKGKRPHRLRHLVRAMRVPADAAIWTGAWSVADEWELDTVYELNYDGVPAEQFCATPVPCVALMDNGERNHVTDIDVLKALLEGGKAVKVFPE